MTDWPGRPPIVAVSDGSAPVRWRQAGAAGSVPVTQVDIVDSLGAGDVLHGALLAFLAREGCSWPGDDRAWQAALADAVAVATESCRHPGATGWLDAD